MLDKTKNEFLLHGQTVVFGEYKNLKSNLRKLLKDSNLPNFYKEETLFELVEEVKEKK